MISPSQTRLFIHVALVLDFLVLALLFFNPKLPQDNLTFRSWRAGDGNGTSGMDVEKQCSFCEGNGTLCDTFGERKFIQAVGYEGTNLRLRRFLAKAATGQGFTVGVIGGSVSKGHGLHDADEMNSHLNMNRVIFDHLDAMFPAPGGVVMGQGGKGKNGFINGAQGGIGSDYFSMCYAEHIGKDVDLILMDQSINDELYLHIMPNYERMLRVLLDLPSKPAIINMQIFGLMYAQIALGGDLHEGMNQFYDIPVVSLRNLYLHSLLESKDAVRDMFVQMSARVLDDLSNHDLRHLSILGHRRMGELVNAYISWQACETSRDMAGYRSDDINALYPVPALPRQFLTQKYDPDLVVPKLEPNCYSMNVERNKLVASKSDGWEKWNWKDKNYLRATKPGSTITFDFTTALGEVQLHYLRSAIFGLGNLKCWVDEDKDRAVVAEGWWDLNVNLGKGITVRTDLTPGAHQLNCELLKTTKDPKGGTEFRLISLMSI